VKQNHKTQNTRTVVASLQRGCLDWELSLPAAKNDLVLWNTNCYRFQRNRCSQSPDFGMRRNSGECRYKPPGAPGLVCATQNNLKKHEKPEKVEQKSVRQCA
jgi:hypothetical protein